MAFVRRVSLLGRPTQAPLRPDYQLDDAAAASHKSCAFSLGPGCQNREYETPIGRRSFLGALSEIGAPAGL